MNPTNQKIDPRVRARLDALRRLAASAQAIGSPHEAAAAMAAIEAEIQKHNLDEATINGVGAEAQTPAGESDDFLVSWSKRATGWQVDLAIGLASAHQCVAFVNWRFASPDDAHLPDRYRRIVQGVTAVGREEDIAVVRYLLEWFIPEIERLGEKRARTERGSFCVGCADGIVAAVQTEVRAARKASSSSALAVIDARLEAANAEVARLYPQLRKVKGARVKDGKAYARGVEVGSRIGKSRGAASGKLLGKG